MKNVFKFFTFAALTLGLTTSCTPDEITEPTITYKYEVKFMVDGYRGFEPKLTTQSNLGTSVYDYQTNDKLIATSPIVLAGGNYHLTLSDIPRWCLTQVDIIKVTDNAGVITNEVLHTANIQHDETTMENWHIDYDLSTNAFATASYE